MTISANFYASQNHDAHAAHASLHPIHRALRDALRWIPQPVTMTCDVAVHAAHDAGLLTPGTRIEVVYLDYGTSRPSLIQTGSWVSWTPGHGGASSWVIRYDGQLHDTHGMMLNGAHLRIEDAFSEERRALERAACAMLRATDAMERHEELREAGTITTKPGLWIDSAETHLREATWELATLSDRSHRHRQLGRLLSRAQTRFEGLAIPAAS